MANIALTIMHRTWAIHCQATTTEGQDGRFQRTNYSLLIQELQISIDWLVQLAPPPPSLTRYKTMTGVKLGIARPSYMRYPGHSDNYRTDDLQVITKMGGWGGVKKIPLKVLLWWRKTRLRCQLTLYPSSVSRNARLINWDHKLYLLYTVAVTWPRAHITQSLSYVLPLMQLHWAKQCYPQFVLAPSCWTTWISGSSLLNGQVTSYSSHFPRYS